MPGKKPGKSTFGGRDVENANLGVLSERTALLGKAQPKLAGVTNLGAHSPKDSSPPPLLSDPVKWVISLSQNYSWKLLTMVVCTTHLLKGFVAGGGDEGLVGKPIEFLFADMGLTAGRMQMLKAVAIAPWALKPVIALVSDGLPLFGLKKMPYVVITTVMSIVAALLLGLGIARSVPMVVLCLFVIFLQVSCVDLLLQAKQSEEVKQNSKLGPQFFTFTWLGINGGQLAGVALLGPLIHHAGPRISFLVAVPFIALVLWPAAGNFMGEKALPVEERGANFHMIRQHPTLCGLTFAIGLLVIGIIFGTFFFSQLQVIGLSIFFAIIILAGFLIFVRPEITGPIVFYFLLGILSFNIDGALFYFYTDTPAEYPAGPHFTAYFYTTGIGTATFLGFMSGFTTGESLFKSWTYRSILKVTIVLRALTQLCLLPVLLRWTQNFGIPDSLWIISVTYFDTMVFAWRWIPKQVMSAHLTPEGVEATTLGLIAGTFNMAMIFSSYCGVFLLDRYGVVPSGQTSDAFAFTNLWKVQVVAAMAPCVLLFLIPMFIPNASQTEALMLEKRDSATHNSWLERWTQQRNMHS